MERQERRSVETPVAARGLVKEHACQSKVLRVVEAAACHEAAGKAI